MRKSSGSLLMRAAALPSKQMVLMEGSIQGPAVLNSRDVGGIKRGRNAVRSGAGNEEVEAEEAWEEKEEEGAKEKADGDELTRRRCGGVGANGRVGAVVLLTASDDRWLEPVEPVLLGRCCVSSSRCGRLSCFTATASSSSSSSSSFIIILSSTSSSSSSSSMRSCCSSL